MKTGSDVFKLIKLATPERMANIDLLTTTSETLKDNLIDLT